MTDYQLKRGEEIKTSIGRWEEALKCFIPSKIYMGSSYSNSVKFDLNMDTESKALGTLITTASAFKEAMRMQIENIIKELEEEFNAL